ncbi:MAG: PQQ-binding-like beta-propeller repeat protein [Acidobacteriaceae bacterium]
MRKILSFGLIFASPALFFCFTAMAQTSAMFHGNPQHTGIYERPVTGWNLLWKFPTGNMVRSSPAVADGTVYFGSNDRNFYALDSHTGELKWKFSAKAAIASSPALADGVLYFTDASNAVYAVTTRGKLKWKEPGRADLPVVGGWDFYLSSPAVVDGTVYVGSGDGSLYALKASNGKKLWSFATRGRVHTSPAVSGNEIVFGSMDGALYAVDRKGKLLWKYQTDTRPAFPMTGVFIGSPTIAKDLNLVFDGARDGHLYAFDLKSGKVVWNLDEQGSWVISTPAYEGGVLYATTSDTELVQAIDAANGKLLWKFHGTGYEFSSPIVAGNQVYAAFWGAGLTALQKKSGIPDGGAGCEGPILSSPVAANGVLYFGCDDGSLYAFH